MILVVTNEIDEIANAVIGRFNHLGIHWGRFNVPEFPLNTQIAFNPAEIEDGFIVDEDGDEIDLSQVKTTWIWKPTIHRIPTNLDQAQATFILDACQITCRALLNRLHAQSFVVNPLDQAKMAEDKGVQLRTARSLGMEAPETLLTNSPKHAREFCRQHSEVIYKLICPPRLEYGDRTVWFGANLLSSNDIEALDDLQTSPGIFQRRIPKRFDLRITIVGDRVFPVEIHSQIDPRTSVDFRMTWAKDIPLPHLVHSLPLEVEQQCLRLARALGLVYCAIDMIVTPDGRYVFLEVNPSGQWGWIEQMTGLPITESLVDLLIRGRI